MEDTKQKVRENKLRRWAGRLGYVVKRSRARSVHLDDAGLFMLIEADGNYVVRGTRFDATLEEIEDFLGGEEKAIAKRQRDAAARGASGKSKKQAN